MAALTMMDKLIIVLKKLVESRNTYMSALSSKLMVEDENVTSILSKVTTSRANDLRDLDESHKSSIFASFPQNKKYDPKNSLARTMLLNHARWEMGEIKEIANHIQEGVNSQIKALQQRSGNNRDVILENDEEFMSRIEELNSHLIYKKSIFARNTELVLENIMNQLYVQSLPKAERNKRDLGEKVDLRKYDNADAGDYNFHVKAEYDSLVHNVTKMSLTLGLKVFNVAVLGGFLLKAKNPFYVPKEFAGKPKAHAKINAKGNNLILVYRAYSAAMACSKKLDANCALSASGAVHTFVYAYVDKNSGSVVSRVSKFATKWASKGMKTIARLRVLAAPANYARYAGLMRSGFKILGKIGMKVVGEIFDIIDLCQNAYKLIGCMGKNADCSKEDIIDSAVYIALDIAAIAAFFLIANPLIGMFVVLALTLFRGVYDAIQQTKRMLHDLDTTVWQDVRTFFNNLFSLELSDDVQQMIDVRDQFDKPIEFATNALKKLPSIVFAYVIAVAAVRGIATTSEVVLTGDLSGNVTDFGNMTVTPVKDYSILCLNDRSPSENLICRKYHNRCG